MSCENIQKPYQQRFKGVENFLRRVAFNLGNTPSQTEVKIISCIPIDVTDLQQKIINLEKQLLEAQEQATKVAEKVNDKPKDKPASVVNSALYGSNFGKQSNTVSYCSNKRIDDIQSEQAAVFCEDCSSKGRKSNVSFVFPAVLKPDTKASFKVPSNKDLERGNIKAVNRYKNIFNARKKRKTFNGKPKLKTQLVYYAHETAKNPFKINNLKLNYHTSLSNTEELCISHLNKVMRRQYDPNEVVEEFSDTSHFTRPICRETGQRDNRCESDICSCCHGAFQNIDNYMTNIYRKPINSISSTKGFYDSNVYDVIPVKEKVNKSVKEKTMFKKPKINLEMTCLPENFRAKERQKPGAMNNEDNVMNPKIYSFVSNKQTDKIIKQKYKKLNADRHPDENADQQTGVDTSKSFCIDCGETYVKKTNIHPKPANIKPSKIIIKINESIGTDEVINESQENSQNTQLEPNSTVDNKILTLNEIKTVLQSVLEEIKTTTNINASKTTKQDADVQKGASSNSMEGDSVLLHSYTYNKSYNTNPYVSSYLTPNLYGYCPSIPYQPMKCLHNFPVYIQPALRRHVCTCYYRKTSSKPLNNTTATATSNTKKDIDKTAGNETEKLIKEIYKSIAVNMDYSTQDISSSEYHNPTSSENASTKITNKDANDKDSFKRDIQVEALLSAIQLHQNQSKLVYTAASTQSEDKSETNRFLLNNQENLKEFDPNSRIVTHQSDDTIAVDGDVLEICSDTESDTVNLEEFKQKVKKKKGFINRILKSVNIFKTKKDVRKQHSDIDEASDSDDYETIYSEASKRNQCFEETGKHLNRGRLRSPYLEQEYRRRWNEHLSFRNQDGSIHSSERPYSEQSNSCRPVYWKNYEARSAIVDTKIPNNCKIFNQSKELERNNNDQKYKLSWLKKHKIGVNCGEQWKKFILEN